MSGTDRLKAKNASLIRTVLILHLVAFSVVTGGIPSLSSLGQSELVELARDLGTPAALALGVAAITRLWLLGILPRKWRDWLVHWRWQFPLPGAKAFSRFGPDCTRVDMQALAVEHGPLPSEPKAQDALFYRIYRRHRDEPGVLDAHQSYLAMRDVAVINAVMAITLPFLAWVLSGDTCPVLLYATLLVTSYLISAWAAQTYSVRFVENVLAAAGADCGRTRTDPTFAEGSA